MLVSGNLCTVKTDRVNKNNVLLRVLFKMPNLILPEPVLWTPKNLITVMLLHIEKASLFNEHFGRSPITSPTVEREKEGDLGRERERDI